MKKSFLKLTRLIVIGLLIIPGIFFVAQGKEKQNVTPFSIEDTKVLGIKLNLEKDKVINILGKPKRVKSEYEDAFGGTVLYFKYNFGTIRLEPLDEKHYYVSEIIIDRPKFAGPRNIEVGDNVTKVISRFPNNLNNPIKDHRRYLYYKQEDNCGFINYDANNKIEIIYYQLDLYTLRFEILNNKVKLIGIFVRNN